jgi:phosphoribosylanthranilate isomerase
MTWVKICGITNLDDGLAAADAGANALGFNFWPKSPRAVTAETAQAVVAKLPPKIDKVGVFVNESVHRIEQIVSQAQLTVVQLHGDEDREFSHALFKALHRGSDRPTIIRSCPAQIFDKPAHESVGWDPVAVGLIEPDEAYRGKRVHKIHVAENGDLFLETHGFRPGVVSGVLLDSSTPPPRVPKSGRRADPGWQPGRAFDWERVQPWAGVINSISKLIVAGGLTPENVQEAIHILHPWGVDVTTGVERAPGKKDHNKVRAFIRAVRAMEEDS